MRPWTAVPRPLLYLLAVVFCAATTLYACLWMYDVRQLAHPVELGFNLGRDTVFRADTKSIPVYNVAPGSPAERAGLRPGDEIVGLNGEPVTSYAQFDRIWASSSPGDRVELTIRRAGRADPLSLEATFQATRLTLPAEGFARAAAKQIMGLFPVLFLIVGFAVLFLRIEDPYAWLLALLFTCFIAAPSFNNLGLYATWMRDSAEVFHAVFAGMLPAMVYLFFAVFPEKSPLERRVPWLKWVAILFGISQVVRLWVEPASQMIRATRLSGQFGSLYAHYLRLTIAYIFMGLGFLSLFLTSMNRQGSTEARRKARVLLWGTLLGILPDVLKLVAADFWGFHAPFWLDTLTVLMVVVYPLSFAYAIVKYRVLEIPALLRRSARYVLVQRGFFVLLLLGALVAIFFFSRYFSGVFAANSQAGMALSAFFGVALVWASAPFVKRGSQRIDRAFFRSSYDARIILQDLAEKTRSVTDRGELAALLDGHLTQALHPKSLVIYAAASDGMLHAVGREVPAGLESLKADAPFLRRLLGYGRAWDVPPPDSRDALENFPYEPFAPECLVPLLGHAAQLVGLLVLGQPLSEEPYSREDKRLLDSVAGQAAIALENIRMAEHIADRMEMERRATHELEIARDVQSRLFPQVMPPLATLDYTGSCVQARQVGGDYYDFLDLGSSHRLDRGATRPLDAAAWHLAFVLADISGKGIAGALLMANLQANLRSRYASALDDLPRLLKSVNQLFYENTPDDRYATLFFAVYDDHSREMEYANCGHNAPLLFRANGSLERLTSTSTVIGLFPDWQCVTRRITLAPGDLLVIYTDGVTEANDAAGKEFGEARLIGTVRACFSLPPARLVASIQNAVQEFSSGEQSDDLTLVIARAR
jgi:sigma-B regulation protein RsbU (phosphoserine phosphatase)